MKKILAITRKEVTIILRDRTALLLMLVAPLGLTLVMNFAFSGVSGQNAGLRQIPVAVVNADEGELGRALVEAFRSPALSELLAVSAAASPAEARKLVDDDQAAAAILIPAGMTGRVMKGDAAEAAAQIEVYQNPGRSIGAGVVRSVVERFAQQVAAGTVGAQVTVAGLVGSGRLEAAQIGQVAPQIGERVALQSVNRQPISVSQVAGAAGAEGFNYLAYYAPSMAILFLMFTLASSSRSLLAERETGTLARLRSTPTRAWELMGGKVAGVFATGVLQMAVLIAAPALLMGVKWGNVAGVALHTLLTVAAVAAMGLMFAGVAKTAAQAAAIGGSVVMVLAAVGGNFVPRVAYPAWLRTLSLLGPNAWGIEGYQKLAAGASLSELAGVFAALVALTALFFGVALIGFRRIVK
ncbi:MAG: ABC transporter permease [Chloroflexi bacterium]|nr:ABC transporter permease [Chloroflexota bacterium]